MTTSLAPVFHSTHAALTFAYNYSLQQYDAPPMSKLMRGAIGSGKGLVGLDGAGQSGFVRAEVGQLPVEQQMVIAARFAPAFEDCDCGRACCSGKTAGREWSSAIEWLTSYAMRAALAGCVSHHRLRQALVMRAFGRKAASLDELADIASVHRNTVSDQNQRVQKCMREIEAKAQRAIDDRLRNCGMVGEE
ncbi:hypothetical protein U5817_09930 [Aromatoleum evansii]|uniref:DNA-binding protein n=1 Tax=Aromatoleum evansii TaxID=59406 RepID=A0ABZ1AR61_AROEV|nr:hypothetical protein U5817_09580 [Aromatoleum evansii]WRL48345.1 hypothetical protein U5817_09930 [Aromatoleum evansii]